MTKKIYLILGATLMTGSAFAGDLKGSIIFQEDCEDLKSPYAGVKIASDIKVEPKGKFGKCFRIERRTVNTIENGDFKQQESDVWLYRDNAVWQKKGGVDNSSCLRISSGEVAIPIIGLKKSSANAFSFYAKSPQNGSLRVIWESGDKETVLVKDQKLAASFIRIKAPFEAIEDSGSLRIQVKGVVIVDNAQLDQGVNFFNSFSKPLKRRGVDRIKVPANGKYFKAEQGAISVWLKVPWLNDPNVISKSICGLFVVNNTEKRMKKWGDQVIMGINAIPRKKITDKLRKGQLYLYTIDAKNRVCSIAETLTKLEPAPVSGWRHLVMTWQLDDAGKMNTVLWLDGKKLVAKSKPYGPAKQQKFIWIGYVNGAYLNGLIDDFAIFNRPLTAEEITRIYTSDKPLSQL
ncbi:MAG: LamG domain-containing protein [Victivallaceae bacterium]|nr:LamG domain-containing protein [Victivallaceae bacterium]